MKIKNFFTVSCLAIVTTFTGCATIITGSTQTLSFKSVPDSSQITITNKLGEKVHVGQTPATVTLKKGAGYFKPESYKVAFTKEGYQTTTVEVNSKLSGWYFGNIIFGGLIGLLIVDPITGAMYSLNPKDVSAVLSENNVSINSNEKTLTVILKEDISVDVLARATVLN